MDALLTVEPLTTSGPGCAVRTWSPPATIKMASSKQLRLAQMWDDERYSDCIVRVGPPGEEETFRANRTLLARCSEVFGKMLFEQAMLEERDSEVHISDCSTVAFTQMLRCSHDLDPEITEKNFVEVFQLARKYNVAELFDAVTYWMADAASSPTTALRALDAAGGLSGSTIEEEVADMLDNCIQTVVSNFEALLEDTAFLSCTTTTMARLLCQEFLCCEEEHLWLSLLRWSEHQPEGNLKLLTKHLRFNVMSPEFFVDRVVPVAVLEDKEVVELLCARATGRSSGIFQDADVPRCGIVGACWKCSRSMAECFEISNGGCTVARNNYPYWKRALGRWNCDDRMQRGLLARCHASFSIRIDHLVTQKGRYTGDILLGVARPDIAPDDHSETRNNAVPAWVYSCRDGTLIAPHCIAPKRMTPATDGDLLRFELRCGKLFVSRNGESLGMAFDDVCGPVVPVVEMNLALSKVTLC
eukprot:TRINITY_DN61311_c0_g1_i1.p1 TRINITY_DN61311_c0_g1~~TRINITY_DN61311_c0_g1_i1.p1  ORF type:complete len:472 (-),score=75.17 TRINITY_DN61311_c0_g1_i1:276-1691(-)